MPMLSDRLAGCYTGVVHDVMRAMGLYEFTLPPELRLDGVIVTGAVGFGLGVRVGHRLGRVAARRLVAMDLLDPFEIDHRHDADFQIAVLGDVDFIGDDGAVQAFVEEEV